MFSRLNTNFRSFFKLYTQEFKHQFQRSSLSFARTLRKPLLATALYTFLPVNVNLQEEDKVTTKKEKEVAKEEGVTQPKRFSILGKIWSVLIHVMRFLHLMAIFAPPILLSPLLLFKRTEGYWMDLFVKAVERSGVVFIKAFQYLSHRRDIIGP